MGLSREAAVAQENSSLDVAKRPFKTTTNIDRESNNTARDADKNAPSIIRGQEGEIGDLPCDRLPTTFSSTAASSAGPGPPAATKKPFVFNTKHLIASSSRLFDENQLPTTSQGNRTM